MRRARGLSLGLWVGGVGLALALGAAAQEVPHAASSGPARGPNAADNSMQHRRAERFLAGRTVAGGGAAGGGAAGALGAARAEHLAMVQAQSEGVSHARAVGPIAVEPRLNPLQAAWTTVGPMGVASQRYGTVSGRVTSVAIDPADATGNTVYVGTTGGGVWKSVNAAGAASAVTFVPLTDTLPVFSANGGGVAIPSLSIGAVSVGPVGAGGDVVLAGTGDTNDAMDSYYGEGILRSADGGVTWTLVQGSKDGVAGNHSFTGLGVTGFAWSSATTGLVVAALSQASEGLVVNALDTTNSVMGLYYSTNAGVTWQMGVIKDGSQVVQTPLPTGANVGGNAATAVVWNAARGRFYAAVRFHGYYESADGVTWTRTTHQPGAGLTTTACPTNPGSTGSAGCPLFRGALAVQGATGDTFALTVDVNNFDQGLWRDVCGAASAGAACAGSSIAFGTQLASGALEIGGGQAGGSAVIAEADYNLSLAVLGTGTGTSGDTILFAGTTDLYRCSLNAGCVLRNTTNAENGCAAPAMVSPSQHAIAVMGGAGTGGLALVYVGNDGGVWRSVDGVNQQQTPCSADDATHFQNLNGGLGSLGEVVSFAQHPTDPTTMLVGLGANGTAATAAAGAVAWPQISAGEGGTVAIDQVNPLNWYVSTEAGVSIRYCGHGNACAAGDFAGAPTIGYVQVKNDASLIDPPFLLDPALMTDVLIGTCRVWRGAAQVGAGWPGTNAISTLLGGAQNASCDGATNPSVRSLGAGGPASGAAAPNAGSTVLYAGMAGTLDGGTRYGGHVFANYAAGTGSGTTGWADVAKNPVTNDVADSGVFNPGGFDVSSVVADLHDATGKTLYATVMGFSGNGVNAPHVYRSLDGGAHWLNISSNLPNAPANGLVVDPNDANTVYLAMDTGVYVTTAVTTCTTGNCWSVYGMNLPNAPVVGLQAASGMATGDGRTGELRVATYGRGVWEIPLLTAQYPAAPLMMLAPGALTFAAQAVATASAPQTVLVTNTGNAALTVSQVVASGDFVETDTCVGAGVVVAPGGTCAVQVRFLPSSTGARTGVLTVYGNVAGGQQTVALTGVGLPAASIVLNPVSVTYSPTNVGAAALAQNITISNTGGVTATLQTPLVTGDFVITANTCGATLAASVGCTVAVAFKPTASGTRNGTFSVTDSVGTQTASLIGLGVLPATDSLAPTTLTFGQQQLNTASAAQQVVLTNTGDAALTLIAGAITSGDFSVVNGCGNSLSGHSTCAMLVTFSPKSVGAGSGVLTVSDTYRSQTVSLSGVGVAPAGVSLSPVGTMAFGNAALGSTTAAQTITLTNNGGLPLTLQSFTVSGDFAIVAGSSTCRTSLAAASACTAQVVFAPSTAGVRTGSLTIADNAAGSPQSIALTGTGIDFSLAANGSTSATITAGSSAAYGLLLMSAAGVPGTVAFTCAPLPAHATCLVNPASAPLGGTTTVTVTVSTSVAGAALQWPMRDDTRAIWAVGVLPLGLLVFGRRLRRVGVTAVLCGMVCCMVGGCAASRLIPATAGSSGGSTTAPTPAGTYNLVVTGTSAGLARTVGLTLIVQ